MPFSVHVLEAPVSTLLCPACGGSPESFLPIPRSYVEECREKGVEHPLDAWETLNLNSYLCPLCGASDRDRLQILYLADLMKLAGLNPVRVLELAPSAPVSNWIRRQPNVVYRSADRWMPGVDDQVDITNLSCYPEAAFDVVICSHVLEHIPDDLQAMRELLRILAPKGSALLLVPISNLVEQVVEALDGTDEAERWRRFGQGDHVRIYGRRGFVERLERAGFSVDTFAPAEPSKFGLSAQNRLYLGRRSR